MVSGALDGIRVVELADAQAEWLEDARFRALAARLKHQDELDDQITQWTRARPAREAMSVLQAAGVPAGRVQKSRELFDDDPQLRHRGLFPTVTHPVTGEHRIDGMPPIMSRSRPEYEQGAPLIGEDNAYVFAELLGLQADEVQRLEDEKVLW